MCWCSCPRLEGGGAGVVPNQPAEFRNKTIGELDWDGKTVWEWGKEAPGGAARQHHDWFREANGNTLVAGQQLSSHSRLQAAQHPGRCDL